MITKNRIEKETGNHIGPTPDQWGKIAGKFTATAEFTLIEHDGKVSFYKNSVSKDFSLDLPAYGDTSSHRYNVGGERSMENLTELQRAVIERLEHEDQVLSVYQYTVDSVDRFLIVTNEQDPMLDLHLSDIYWDIVDAYASTGFEFRPISRQHFSDEELPDGAIPLI